MNIEELFDNELYHNYGMLTTDDANILINYLKEETMEYITELQKELNAKHAAELDAAAERFWKEIASSYRKGYLEGSASNDVLRQRIAELEKHIAELELRLGCCRDASTGKDLLIAELEAQNLNMMALFRDFYELEFNRDECWDIIKKYGGEA